MIMPNQTLPLNTFLKAIAVKDQDTANHTKRIGLYCVCLAGELDQPLSKIINEPAQLHDVGKIGVPDHVLFKMGKLSDKQFTVIKTHPVIGYDLLKDVHVFPDPQQNKVMLEIVQGHHERWSGSGYPNGKKGKDIPLPARIAAVADVLDAMLYARPYKKKKEPEQVFSYFARDRARSAADKYKEFDPEVIEVLFKRIEDIAAILKTTGP